MEARETDYYMHHLIVFVLINAIHHIIIIKAVSVVWSLSHASKSKAHQTPTLCPLRVSGISRHVFSMGSAPSDA
jgi:hypothetical protein